MTGETSGQWDRNSMTRSQTSGRSGGNGGAMSGESPGHVDQAVEVGDERLARMALASVSEPGDKQLADLVDSEGPLAVWSSLSGSRRDTRWGRRKALVRLQEMVLVMQRRGIRFVMPGDTEWPEQLDDLAHVELGRVQARPLGLWVSGPGHLAAWVRDSVAIVGTRTSTHYGEVVTGDLAAGLALRDMTVVSGGAYGIDVCAHRAALAVDGRTVAVLASGVDQPYPRGNARVFDEIRARGLLVSELPPGERPSRPRFLSRNRVIAALSMGSVMVEARVRSGAQNTLGWAERLSRVRMAVPGPITSAQSEGPHHQLREDATLVTSAAEIIERIAPMGQQTLPLPQGPSRVVDRLPADLNDVFEAVPGSGGRLAEEIAAACGRTLVQTLTDLGNLEERGMIEENAEG
ncbi:MAG: DNA-processing protein DprA, partial [Propionibacteriaceae bacterium]|nr:DNA-processing protein DprA [Propionibacteriaceae bacterium]